MVFFFVSFSLSAQDFDDRLKDANNKLSEDNYAEALKIYEDLLSIDSSDSTTIAWLNGYAGICNESMGDFETAISYYQKAIESNFPNLSVYDKLYGIAKKGKNYTLQESTLLSKLEMFPETELTTLKSLCYVYANLTKYDKLFDTASQLQELDPNNFKYYYFKGLAKQYLGDTQAAIAFYKEACTFNISDFSTNRNLGLLIYNNVSKKYELENKKYNSLNKPTRLDYHNYNKATELLQKQYLESEPFLIQAYEKKPDDVLKKALYNLYVRTNRKEKAQNFH